jgi:UPF0755 protein
MLIIFGLILLYSNILVYPVNCNDDFILTIKKHSSATDIANILDENTCINSTIFKIAISITFNQKNIKPGLYKLKNIYSAGELVRMITSISKERKLFTVYEGSTLQSISLALSEKLNIDKEVFLKLCYSKSYIKSLGINMNINSLEGFIYPDTYILLDTYDEEEVLSLFTERFFDIYNNKVYPLSKESNLDILEIITLASIIQAEARIIDEMPIISSVYNNRINKKIKLEADPTILYFMDLKDLENFKRDPRSKKAVKIFRKYKALNNKYNTYMRKGLPPGPINNPGLDALLSAIKPAITSKTYLYFVADGTGRHIFSETLNEHKLAIRKVRYGY